ncbi:MAG: Uma2 family endonuclease [Streptosporangiales bacterium]|nr:Uma2 family endonuclease [Streptosporangiales bacterium]
MTRKPEAPTGDLLQDFLSLETPEGYRAELIGGNIVVVPPPDGSHGHVIEYILRQVLRNSAEDMNFDGHRGLVIPAPGLPHSAHVIPDIVFAPAELDVLRNAPSWMEADGVAMTVEVTSSQPGPDRNEKRQGYAAAGIPLYLLVDRDLRRVTLFSHPRNNDYARTDIAAFGEKIDLPDPFSFTLDTGPFTD